MAERGLPGFPIRAGFLALILLLSAFGSFPAAAQDVYTATGIAVDLEGDIAGLRDRAIAQASRAAFRKVLEQIADPGDLAGLALPSDSEIGAWVEDFEIEDEKIAANRYIGRFTFRFQALPVQDFLTENGIAFVEAVARPVLVLPIYRDPAGTRHFWDAGNAWLAAWRARPADNSLVPIVLPNGDASDQRMVSLDQALAGDLAALSALSARYGTGAVLIAEAEESPLMASGRIDMALRLRSPGAIADPAAAPDVALSNDRADRAALLGEAVAEIRARIERDWKTGNLVDPNQRNALSVSVPLTGLDQWVAIKRRLGQVALLKSVNLTQLTIDNAALDLSYIGGLTEFTQALAQAGLGLEDVGEGAAILSLQPNVVITQP